MLKRTLQSGGILLALCLSAATPAAKGDDVTAAATSPKLSLTTVEGDTVEIALTEFNDGKHLLGTTTGGVKATWLLDDLVRIVPNGSDREPEQPPRGPDVCVFQLDGGGVLCGRISLSESPSAGVIRADVGMGGDTDLMVAGLSAVRISSSELAAMEADFQARISQRRPGTDTLVLMQAGKPVAVNGSLEKLDGRGWEFRYGGKTRSGSLEHVYGFVFGAPAVPHSAPAARVRFRNGNQLPAELMSSNGALLMLNNPAVGRVDVAWADIVAIDLQSDRVVQVSSLRPIERRQESLPGADWPARMNSNVTGGPLRLGPKSYANGIGVHAYSSLAFDLNGAYERFSAVVGIDESVAPNGSVIFRVMVDGKTAYESPILRGGGQSETVSVSLDGAKHLKLECDPADELDLSDHADWANAVLIRTAKKETR